MLKVLPWFLNLQKVDCISCKLDFTLQQLDFCEFLRVDPENERDQISTRF